jgi:hypothetical protein
MRFGLPLQPQNLFRHEDMPLQLSEDGWHTPFPTLGRIRSHARLILQNCCQEILHRLLDMVNLLPNLSPVCRICTPSCKCMKRFESPLEIVEERYSLAIVFGSSIGIVEGLDQIVGNCNRRGDIAG